MKILQVNPFPPEHLGGSEIFCKNLAINLKREKNIYSEILTSNIFKRDVKTDYIDEDIKIIYKKCYYNLGGINPLVNIYSFIKRSYQKYDLIHAHSYIFLTSLQLALLKRVRNFPLILHIHGGIQTPTSLSSNLLEYIQIVLKTNVYDKIFGKFMINKADAIISVSNKDLAYIKRLFDISEKKTFYIPNAVDINKFKRNDTLEKKYITFIGRLTYIKGIDIFLKIIEKLYKKNNNLEFLIIGNGQLKPLVEVARKKLPITHLDSFPYDKIEKIYNISKVIMITSRFEGVPTTILESLACQTPVIASNVGGISEIIRPYENGFLFKIDQYQNYINTFLNIIKDDNLLSNLGKNGCELIKKKYSWSKITEQIKGVYDQIL